MNLKVGDTVTAPLDMILNMTRFTCRCGRSIGVSKRILETASQEDIDFFTTHCSRCANAAIAEEGGENRP